MVRPHPTGSVVVESHLEDVRTPPQLAPTATRITERRHFEAPTAVSEECWPKPSPPGTMRAWQGPEQADEAPLDPSSLRVKEQRPTPTKIREAADLSRGRPDDRYPSALEYDRDEFEEAQILAERVAEWRLGTSPEHGFGKRGGPSRR